MDLESDLEFQDWGLIDYQEALDRQMFLIQEIWEGKKPGVLVFCSHPPIVTLGRATQEDDIQSWSGPILEISRGGRATYHGPSQLIIYPLLNLNFERKGRKAHEIHGYLRLFENTICDALKLSGIHAVGKTYQQRELSGGKTDETGVWVGSQKVASLGVAVKNWIAFHGAAINFYDDPQAFSGIKPCGFNRSIMTNVERLAGRKISYHEFQDQLKELLLRQL